MRFGLINNSRLSPTFLRIQHFVDANKPDGEI